MTFWNTLDVSEQSELERKLDSPDCTLKMILEDTFCLQEIRNSNEKLLAYLKREPIIRELINSVLNPKPSEKVFHRKKYGFVHYCCEAICMGARDLFADFVSYGDLVRKLTNYLKVEDGDLNALCVSYYTRLIIGFLSAQPDKMIVILKESDFLEYCLENLKFCSVFELLYSIQSSSPDPEYKESVKQWFTQKNFIKSLVALFSPENSSQSIENASLLWVELLKTLRDFQVNVEKSSDPLLDCLQSEEAVVSLLQKMFPDTGKYSPVIVVEGAKVLNALLETNNVRNSPAWLLSQEAQNVQNSNLNDPSQNSDDHFVLDEERIVETKCVQRTKAIINCILDGFYAEVSSDAFYGDVMVQCLKLLVNLLNTNFLPTHLELVKAFSGNESASFRALFKAFQENPTRSIYNTSLTTMISYILYSSTGDEQRPLIDFIFKDFKLPLEVQNALEDPALQRKSVSSQRLSFNQTYTLNDTYRSNVFSEDLQNITFAANEEGSDGGGSEDKDDSNQEFFGKCLESEEPMEQEQKPKLEKKEQSTMKEIGDDATNESAENTLETTLEQMAEIFKTTNLVESVQDVVNDKTSPIIEGETSFEEQNSTNKNTEEDSNMEGLDETDKLFKEIDEAIKIDISADPVNEQSRSKLPDVIHNDIEAVRENEDDPDEKMSISHSSVPSQHGSADSALYTIARRAFFNQLAGRINQSLKNSPNACYIEAMLKANSMHELSSICNASTFYSSVSEQNATKVANNRPSGIEQLIVDELGMTEQQSTSSSSLPVPETLANLFDEEDLAFAKEKIYDHKTDFDVCD